MRSAASTASRIACSAAVEIDHHAGLHAARVLVADADDLDLVGAAAQQTRRCRSRGFSRAMMQQTLLEPTSRTGDDAGRPSRGGPSWVPSQLISASSPACPSSSPCPRLEQRLAALRRLCRQAGRRARSAGAGRPRRCRAQSRPCSRSIARRLGDRRVLAALGQLDGDAVLHAQVPAPLGDADVALHPRCASSGSSLILSTKLGRAASLAPSPTTSGSDAWRPPANGAMITRRLLDEGEVAAVLPDREGLALLDLDSIVSG